MVIETQFVSVWGQLRTRKLHIMYSVPPQNPASMLKLLCSGKNDINVYMHIKQAVPAHCTSKLNIQTL